MPISAHKRFLTAVFALLLPLCCALAQGSGVKLRTVVIDPGHGGHDSGAISLDGELKEKNVVLDVALRLGGRIKKAYPDVKVVYTRDKDVFIPLDKRADIAILRTLGASGASIMKIFVVQGAVVGVAGTLAGLVLGLAVALNVDTLVPALESMLGMNFLPKDIYLISRMPSEPLASDIVPIALIALLLAFVATLYPSWRASRVNPAEALRYE